MSQDDHNFAKQWQAVHSRIVRAERATRAYETAKAASSEAVRLACRLEAAKAHVGSYHADLSRAATIRRAAAEIAKQEAIIAKAQRLLQEARAGLARAEATEIADDSAERARLAQEARERATHLQAEAARLKAELRSLPLTAALYRRRQECLDILSERAGWPGSIISVKPDRIEIADDEAGDLEAGLIYTLDESGLPTIRHGKVVWKRPAGENPQPPEINFDRHGKPEKSKKPRGIDPSKVRF